MIEGKESHICNYVGGANSGTSMSLLPYTPVRDGYTFNGWNTKKMVVEKISNISTGDPGIIMKNQIKNLIKIL